jgi:hypothetical protein
MMKKLIILLVMLPFSFYAAELDSKFVTAIHQVETGGKTGTIYGDGGKALGPFQIHHGCWRDAVEFDKSIGGSYSDCSKLDYSKKIMSAYLNRYGKPAIVSKDYETLAKIWNGGPKGASKSSTQSYWMKVQKNIKP